MRIKRFAYRYTSQVSNSRSLHSTEININWALKEVGVIAREVYKAKHRVIDNRSWEARIFFIICCYYFMIQSYADVLTKLISSIDFCIVTLCGRLINFKMSMVGQYYERNSIHETIEHRYMMSLMIKTQVWWWISWHETAFILIHFTAWATLEILCYRTTFPIKEKYLQACTKLYISNKLHISMPTKQHWQVAFHLTRPTYVARRLIL